MFLYPSGQEWIQTYKQKQLLKSLEAIDTEETLSDIGIGNSPEVESTLEPSRRDGEVPLSASEWQTGNEEERKRALEKKRQDDYAARHAEGILKIDKIQLKLPILTGATKKNMNLSVASVEHTGKPGQVGNYAIAGHRNYTYGRNFNRLGEIEVHDLIEVQTGDEHYQYIVTDVFRVKPDETWVLDQSKKKTITLITCDPMINPTFRLIIKGELVEKSNF